MPSCRFFRHMGCFFSAWAGVVIVTASIFNNLAPRARLRIAPRREALQLAGTVRALHPGRIRFNGAIKNSQEVEMYWTRFLAVMLISMAGSVGAVAQQKQNGDASGGGTTVQSGAAGKSMSNEAEKGNSKPGADTLMDKRAKAMSPEGASSGSKSGEIKQ